MKRFLATIAALTLIGCQQDPTELAAETGREHAATYPSWITPTEVERGPVEAPRVSLDLPNGCDPLVVKRGRNGAPRLSKRMPSWWRSEATRAEHREQVKLAIYVVVDELGGDELAAELLYRKAVLESSANEGAVHILDPDLDANDAWAHRGRSLSAARWRKARVPVSVEEHGGLTQVGTVDAWRIGRGLYGMNTGLFMARWSTDAPPWALCDLAVATVTAVWSIRAGQRRCRDRSLRGAYRWISAGRCTPRSPEKERIFDRLARGHVRGLRLERIDAQGEADFGGRWPQETSDPAQVLGAVRARLEAL